MNGRREGTATEEAGGDHRTVIRERFRRRADAFEALVAATPSSRWSAQSPCSDWDARGVVEHIVTMLGVMLRPFDRQLSAAPSVADDPLAAFRAARTDVEAILDDPELCGRVVATPATGDMPAADMIDQVVSQDLVFHGWDLAKATGQDATIDPDEIESALNAAAAFPAQMYEPGAFGAGVVVFGPKVEVAPEAGQQARLLGLIGRDPHWRA